MSVGVMTVGVMSVGVMTVGVMSVGEITVGVMTVGVMRRPRLITYLKINYYTSSSRDLYQVTLQVIN